MAGARDREAGGLVVLVRVERPGVEAQPNGSELASEFGPSRATSRSGQTHKRPTATGDRGTGYRVERLGGRSPAQGAGDRPQSSREWSADEDKPTARLVAVGGEASGGEPAAPVTLVRRSQLVERRRQVRHGLRGLRLPGRLRAGPGPRPPGCHGWRRRPTSAAAPGRARVPARRPRPRPRRTTVARGRSSTRPRGVVQVDREGRQRGVGLTTLEEEPGVERRRPPVATPSSGPNRSAARCWAIARHSSRSASLPRRPWARARA